MTKREIYEKYDDLIENELNKKSNKTVYVKNNIMTFVIKQCRGKKKRDERSIDGFQNVRNTKSNQNICKHKNI